jgi:hypothetical protein
MEYIMLDNKGVYPTSVDKRIKDFLSGFLQKDPSRRVNDAWKSWHELKVIREKVFGSKNQFLTFDVMRIL